MGIEDQNLFDNTAKRDRTIYAGQRGLSPVLLRELREGDNGARILLKVSGSF